MAKLNTRVGRYKKLQQHKQDDANKAKRQKGKKRDEVPKKVAMISKPQRSGKHKKIKSIEPVYKDKKSLEANRAPASSGFNDDEMTGAFKEFIKLKGAVKKKKIRRKQRLKELGPGAEFVDHAMNAHMKGMTKPLRPVPKFAQGKRESDEAFLNRVENMTSLVIKKSNFEDKYKVQVDNDNKSDVQIKKKSKRHDRQMERLKVKKQKKKEKIKAKRLGGDEDFQSTRGSEEVTFGEQALAPPVLTAQPRKSEERKAHRPKTGSLLLNEIMRGNQNSAGGSGSVVHSRQLGETVKRKNMSLAQQQVMDAERQRAIDMYRAMKEKKLAARS